MYAKIVIFALFASASAGIIPAAYPLAAAGVVAPYATSFDAHAVNHAIAAPVVAARAVLPAVAPVVAAAAPVLAARAFAPIAAAGVVAPYATSFDAHTVNHAIAAPVVAARAVLPAVAPVVAAAAPVLAARAIAPIAAAGVVAPYATAYDSHVVNHAIAAPFVRYASVW